MNIERTKNDQRNNNFSQRKVMFMFAIIFGIATIFIDVFVESELFSRVMFYLQQKKLPPFEEVKPYQLLLTTLFAFGVPISMVLAFIYTIRNNEKKSTHIRNLTLSSFLILALVGITPAILGREMNAGLFGILGFIILVAVMLTFWFISNFRYRTSNNSKIALDYKLLGYLCFGIVTWQVCGFATTPAYAIFPEKMIELGVRPFAIGQLKSITVYFTLGWIFTAIGYYKTSKISLNEDSKK